MAFRLPFLSAGPRVRVTTTSVVASTGYYAMLFSLASVLRNVRVDRRTQTIAIEDRFGWAFECNREIQFSEVRAVTYGYDDASLLHRTFSVGGAFDVYSVGLRLYDDEQVHLFRFMGPGTWTHEGLLSDFEEVEPQSDALVTGSQDGDSLVWAELVSKMVGVPIRPPK